MATVPGEADLVVVNTCAFIEAARQESIDTVLALERRRAGGRLVVTGCSPSATATSPRRRCRGRRRRWLRGAVSSQTP